MTTQPPVALAWAAYQAAAGRDPYSDETKRTRAAYKRALTAASKRRQAAALRDETKED